MLYGGPQATIFGLIVACFVQWLIALGLAEQASAFPSSGGMLLKFQTRDTFSPPPHLALLWAFFHPLSSSTRWSWGFDSLMTLNTRAVSFHIYPGAREAQEHCSIFRWHTQRHRLVGHHLLRYLEQCAVHNRHDRFRGSDLRSSEMAYVLDVPGLDSHNTYVGPVHSIQISELRRVYIHQGSGRVD